MMGNDALILENGLKFCGKRETPFSGNGEIVFTTGMTGYVQSMTDPSFDNQILVFTYPLIGNYGVEDSEFWESPSITVSGVVVSEACSAWNHPWGRLSLKEWCHKFEVPLLSGVDTRKLTQVLRDGGSLRGRIGEAESYPELTCLRRYCSYSEIFKGAGLPVVLIVDCGMKESILNQLKRFPLNFIRVPYDYDYSDLVFDGLFISNGPGDPTDYIPTIDNLKKQMKGNKPIFGVCLGHQIMALASGAQTNKLKFGHRGQNQPCYCESNQRSYLTSQNHGYAVDERSLGEDWSIWFRNLNDGSVEGVSHKEKPFFSVQFHPEAGPGPTDTVWIFDRFYECLMKK